MLLWLSAFAGTLLIEAPVYGWGLRSRLGLRRALLAALLVNVVTHPLAWRLTLARSWPRFAAVEAGVWLVEAAALLLLARAQRRRLPALDTLVLALVATALSAGVGLWLSTAIG